MESAAILLLFIGVVLTYGDDMNHVLAVIGEERANCPLRGLMKTIKHQSATIFDLQNKIEYLSQKCRNPSGTLAKRQVNPKEGYKCADLVLDMYRKTTDLRALDIKYNQLEHDMIRLKRGIGEDEDNRTLTSCDRPITGVSPATVVHRIFGDQIHFNAWMRDSAINDGRIWLLRGNTKTFYVAEYASETHLRANITTIVYKLPFACDGTGHVVYKGQLICNKAGAANIMKYDFDLMKVVVQKSMNAYATGTYAYKSGSYTTIDIAVDEMGLWVIYSNGDHANNVVVSKLNPDTLDITHTWKTSIPKSSLVDAFMRCGVLYTINSNYASQKGCLYYKFDTNASTRTAVCVRIPPFRDLASHSYYHYYVSYNPMDKKLYASTYQHLLTYNVMTY